tara:strand:+ start:3196 stop:3624 length:429 start_codon:yes stop_codon:yes gene_type:complete
MNNKMTYNKENIFAKIIKGEAECVKVLENDYILSFMDVMPQTPGHTLLIPKYGTEDIFNLPNDYFTHLMDAKQRIAKAIKNAYEPTGVMIMQLNGKEAGQTVFHLHFHIIPRKDGLNYKFHSSEIVSFSELEKEAEKIKKWL